MFELVYSGQYLNVEMLDIVRTRSLLFPSTGKCSVRLTLLAFVSSKHSSFILSWFDIAKNNTWKQYNYNSLLKVGCYLSRKVFGVKFTEQCLSALCNVISSGLFGWLRPVKAISYIETESLKCSVNMKILKVSGPQAILGNAIDITQQSQRIDAWTSLELVKEINNNANCENIQQ